MENEMFNDPVTGESFSSESYEVRTNGSNTILRTKAPSGAMAVRVRSSYVTNQVPDETTVRKEQFASDITQQELNNMAEDYQEQMGISTNPGAVSRGIGKATAGIGGLGAGSWQALRLPSVAFGQRIGLISKAAGVLKSFGIERGTFRSGPYANLITARMWTDYINNMDMQDVGAELSADVSTEEKLSIFQFCKEWENDPGHVSFSQRLFNTKDVNAIDEIAKGNIVYDLMTGGVSPGPGLPKDTRNIKHDKMYRLAVDIINSMRLKDYNFYTLNLVHKDEGTRLYDEFMANYVPLESDEVEIVHEIMRGLDNHGQSYAMKTVNEDGDPMGAYDLMIRLGNAYNAGDTRLVRSILDTLFAYPYGYVPQVGYKGLFDSTSSRYLGKQPYHLYINGNFRWILPSDAINESQIKDDGRKFGNIPEGTQLIEVLSYTYPKPIGVFTKQQGQNKYSFMPWTQFEMTSRDAASLVPSTTSDFSQRVRDAEQESMSRDRKPQGGGGGGGGKGGSNRGKRGGKRKNPAPGRKGKKDGTLSLGRGDMYHIEILPKTQINVATKGAPGVDKKTGKPRSKGRPTLKGQGATSAERAAGITDAFGTYMHYGKDKKTGKKVPYVIKIPAKLFKPHNVQIEGKTIKTLMPMKKSNKKQVKAWADFLSIYGYPKVANTKGDPVRFKIHKPTRGTFYRKLAQQRKKVGA